MMKNKDLHISFFSTIDELNVEKSRMEMRKKSYLREVDKLSSEESGKFDLKIKNTDNRIKAIDERIDFLERKQKREKDLKVMNSIRDHKREGVAKMLLSIFIVFPLYIIVLPFHLIWKSLIKIPATPSHVLGLVRCGVMFFLICVLHKNYFESISYGTEIKNFLGTLMPMGVASFLIALTNGLLAINFIAQLMVLAGFHTLNATVVSGKYTNVSAYDGRKLTSSDSQVNNSSTGYGNIDEGMEYLNGMLGMQSTRGKANMLSDLFGGNLKL